VRILNAVEYFINSDNGARALITCETKIMLIVIQKGVTFYHMHRTQNLLALLSPCVSMCCISVRLRVRSALTLGEYFSGTTISNCIIGSSNMLFPSLSNYGNMKCTKYIYIYIYIYTSLEYCIKNSMNLYFLADQFLYVFI